MFVDSLFDSASTQRFHRGWATCFSFGLQAVAVGLLLLLPLFYTQALPQLSLLGQLVAPTAPPGPPLPSTPTRVRVRSSSNFSGDTLLTPTRIPAVVQRLDETEVPPAPEIGTGVWVQGGTGPARSTVTALFGNGNTVVPLPPPPVVATRPIRVSHMMEGNLIHRVQPEYPPLARQARIQGSVVLRAIINREGRIENLQVLSGHPMLVSAALEAVRQWRYRPYILNDQPVEVETTVTVNFVLGAGG